MQMQRGIKKDSSLTRFVLEAHPIIEHFIEVLQIRQIICTYVPTDRRMKVGVDKTLALLIHNILTSPNALYEIEDWLNPLDPRAVGLTPEEVRFIHDDRMGRDLFIFYQSRHQDVFFRLALRAIKIFQLECSRIHHDTTTVTFAGKYGGWSATTLLTYGNNKDHRPDLKQLVLGLNVTADGAVPISHRIFDGNQTDDRLHPANHKALQRLLQRTDFIYVADCKLATRENLGKMTGWHGRFVSVMPRTWKEDEQFRKSVRQGKIRWKHILSRKNNRKPESKLDRYYVLSRELSGTQILRFFENEVGVENAERDQPETTFAWRRKKGDIRVPPHPCAGRVLAPAILVREHPSVSHPCPTIGKLNRSGWR